MTLDGACAILPFLLVQWEWNVFGFQCGKAVGACAKENVGESLKIIQLTFEKCGNNIDSSDSENGSVQVLIVRKRSQTSDQSDVDASKSIALSEIWNQCTLSFKLTSTR